MVVTNLDSGSEDDEEEDEEIVRERERIEGIGGLSGRTEKPTDACYSFWCGAALHVRSLFHFSILLSSLLICTYMTYWMNLN